MLSERALEAFEGYLRRRGHEGAPKSPVDGFGQMLEFYREVRFRDVDLAAGGDKMLFQWGAYDWGGGPYFEIGLTRQFSREGEGEESIRQLHLTYRFAAAETLRALWKGSRWCERPAELSGFGAFLMGHPAVKAVGSRVDGLSVIDFECAG